MAYRTRHKPGLVLGKLQPLNFSVSTTQPDKYIAVFDKLVDKIKTEGFNAR
jgi:zinc protease